jgi:hypothetical protein
MSPTNKVQAKAFFLAMSLFANDSEKTKQYFTDKRITKNEKDIIKAYFLLKKNKLTEALALISQIQYPLDQFALAIKELLHGVIVNNLGDYHKATIHLKAALEILEEYTLTEVHHFYLNGLQNLFIANYNLRDKAQLKRLLDKIQKTPYQNQGQKYIILSCEFDYATLQHDFTQANSILNEIDRCQQYLPQAQWTSHLISRFEFYIMQEQFVFAREVLNELKRNRSFSLSQNYVFIKTLLDHIEYDAPIYVYASDFKDFDTLFWQLQVITHLESGDYVQADEYWMNLKQKFPKLYASPFQYKGDKCLFSLGLTKHNKRERSQIDQQSLSESGPDKLVDLLFHILKKSKGPIQKEELFKQVWGVPVSSKDDMVKLSRLLYKAKKKHNISVQTRKGAYLLSPSKVS